MTSMTSEQREACHRLIHRAALAAGAAGSSLAQLPLADQALVLPIHVAMIVSLGKIFGADLPTTAAQAVLLSVGKMNIGRAASQLLVGWVPGVGNVFNGATAVLATETLGWSIANRFASGWRPD